MRVGMSCMAESDWVAVQLFYVRIDKIKRIRKKICLHCMIMVKLYRNGAVILKKYKKYT